MFAALLFATSWVPIGHTERARISAFFCQAALCRTVRPVARRLV
ncbi:hypothetical protein HYI44_25030 [Pseudomonas sp. Y24-6]|nr:hypothetical protein [Pseudomonas sp. Y24-6]MCH4876000.1 hypothetical protein [Pseudomonas sp. TMW22090]